MAAVRLLPMIAALMLSAFEESVADRLRRAKELLDRGEAAQAIAIYRGLARAHPQDPRFPLNAAIAEYKAGLFPQAIADSLTALHLDPKLYPARLFLGASHLELGDAAQALEPLRTAVAANPEDRNARVLLAGALLALERYEEAAGQYGALVEALPAVPRVWYGLGRSREGQARRMLQRLQQEAPGTVYALAAAADYELSRGQLGRALALYRQALLMDPSATWLHAAVADLYDQAGHQDWSRVERAKAPPAEPPPGLLQDARRAAAAAASAYAKLNELPDSPEKHEHAADRQEGRGQFRAAADKLRAALRLAPGTRSLQWRLGLALLNSNDPAAALPVFEQLRKLKPDSAELNFLCGSALLNSEQAERALPYLESAVHLDPKHVSARGALGQAYLEIGRARDAAPLLETALAADDPGGTRHYQLARAYQAQGLRERAAAALRAYSQWKARPQEAADPPLTPP